MDWNRRWAKDKMLPVFMWHKAWADNVKKIATLCQNKGIKYITLWALSTDNLKKRPKEEVEWIIKLINNIESFLWDMLKENLKFETIWNIEELPLESQLILQRVKDNTKNNSWITLVLALVYWWQDEIIRAIKRLNEKKLEINEKNFESCLDTAGFGDVDLLIRTSGEIRLSNYLLWQNAYAEMFFTETLWPDFDVEELDDIIEDFNKRQRRFGGV